MKHSLFVLLAALSLPACAAPRQPLVPKELPHYPCKDQTGKYYACSYQEWMYQITLEGQAEKRAEEAKLAKKAKKTK